MVDGYDTSGINSLGGFVFQIDVFILNALKLKPGETLEYENIEDVSIRQKEDLDKKEDLFRSNLKSSSAHKVIQVKRTDITNNVAEKVLMNWILLEKSSININEYVLWGDSSYQNNGNIKNIIIKDLYKKIISTK